MLEPVGISHTTSQRVIAMEINPSQDGYYKGISRRCAPCSASSLMYRYFHVSCCTKGHYMATHLQDDSWVLEEESSDDGGY